MKRIFALSGLLFLLAVGNPLLADGEITAVYGKHSSISLNGKDYLFRWSHLSQFEFTPSGQEDLNSWNEMVTLNIYPIVNDGDSLALIANKVLSAYKNANGKIVRTNSIPRTSGKPAEHFVAAMIGSPQYLEFAAARFVLIEGKGVGIIYSHRFYGKTAASELGTWVVQNGALVEKAVMECSPAIPK